VTTAADAPSRYRLPTTVRPHHYDLSLEVDPEDAVFQGTTVARVEVTEPVAEVVLNAVELDIAQAWVRDGEGRRIEAGVSLDPETERATLSLSTPLRPGPAEVHLRYTGALNDKLVGFYRTTFTDQAGEARVAASTQFEATHARRAFPCWDEPAFKATFAVTLVVPEGQLAVSNAREVERLPLGDGRVRFRFADTIVMSTYLVAFVVGPFAASPAVDVGGVPLRVVYPLGQEDLTGFALEAGRFGLEYFADYYGIPYPGDKLDLVAVPDFAFGAMENLGCITFREVLLLVDPATTTQPELQRVADVIFHELAHMWFGDLVTMKWWNGLWLNEAFATFMEMRCTDAFRPAWQRWVDVGLSRTAAFDTASLASTRPIEFEVVSPADAEGMFDILTYEKGAAVLRMVEQYLGEDRFRAGVRRYLEENAYGNTETSDLWDAIEAATGQPVRAVADSWIFQGGYPLISVTLSADGRRMTLRQEPFRYLAEGGLPDTTWKVPVLARVHRRGRGPAGAELVRVLLEGPEAAVDLDPPADSVLLVNAGGHGFYRVRYSDSLLGALTARAQDELAPIERYALVDDTYAAMLAGRTTSAAFLALARGLADDDDLSVWQRLSAALGALSRLLEGDDLDAYRRVVRDLAGPALDVIGWEPAEGEGDRGRELRATLFTLLGTVGNDADVIARAGQLHEAALAGAEGVDPSLAAAALNVVAAHGGPEEYERCARRATEPGTPQEQRRYLYSLADFRVDELIDRTLERCRSGDIRTQDGPYVVARALVNRHEGPRAWAFVARHWTELNERFPSNTIVRMLAPLATFTDPRLAHEVEAFFAEHPIPQGAKTLAQHLEKLRVNVALAERERVTLRQAVS
jgi:puromycin-sensitive aminopeptidase